MNLVNLSLRQRLSIWRWVLPIGLGLLAFFYEIGPERWIQIDGISGYFDLDIVFYGLVVPIVAFATLTMLAHWFDKKEVAEKQVRASEQRLASLMAASADAMIGLDPTGRIVLWNRGAELLFGYTAQGIYGRSLVVLFGTSEAADVEVRWLMANVRQAAFIRGHETTCHNAAGHQIEIELTATDLVGEDQQLLGTSIIMRDVTERKHRESEIRQLNASLNEQVAERTRELAEKVEQLARANRELQNLDQMRTEFVSVVSHQIRAPLTNMRGAFERMNSGCASINTICSRMFLILERQVERLDRLVQDVLNASRIEAGELVLQSEPMSVLPVIQEVIDQTRVRTDNRRFNLVAKPGLPFVLADRDRTAEVLANLLDNAHKYSPSGKEIVVEVCADQTEVTLSVRDAGYGIRTDDLEHIFEKFYRADNSDSQPVYGHGLGLYICRQLVNAQGGHIWVENAPNGGAIFSFTLPAVN